MNKITEYSLWEVLEQITSSLKSNELNAADEFANAPQEQPPVEYTDDNIRHLSDTDQQRRRKAALCLDSLYIIPIILNIIRLFRSFCFPLCSISYKKAASITLQR